MSVSRYKSKTNFWAGYKYELKGYNKEEPNCSLLFETLQSVANFVEAIYPGESISWNISFPPVVAPHN